MTKFSIQPTKIFPALFLIILFVSTTTAQTFAGDCFDSAAAYQGINPNVLRAISRKENGRCDATVHKNKNGSVDVGCMQINSVHFKTLSSYGVVPNDLSDSDQCKNIYVGAWHYKRMIAKYGNTWAAVGAYHSETPHLRDAYAADVYRIWLQLSLLQNDEYYPRPRGSVAGIYHLII